ncbi:erythromycin esterase family protein [Alteraurantiacibacter aquimixticola]|uniref:Erythromycin esterase family protein n=1 Tax=Alteraurantiacibacter aquimixticola TaxID=2489173 RepID=A0A4T3F105_9SPHN|nr:erythromycin esterase family protein [Alteraurantiacibacter aquimixticola]TIX50722.1 erythromycin esterase family protein [Alteraurantiacibacter aquimixticola]
MTAHSPIRTIASDLPDTLRARAELLPSPDTPDFGKAFDRFGDARIVLLGEATHGTHEFYTARAQITRRLIEEHGFNIIAVEGDWPDIARLDEYVRHGDARPRAGEPFARFPTWMWRNKEVLAFADWLRGHNAELPEEQRACMRGLDIYSLRESMHSVIAYLDEHCADEAAEARRRYGCLTPWQDEPQFYGRAVKYSGLAECEDIVVSQLDEMLKRRMEFIAEDGERYFDAEQNARIVRAAERYYRSMYRGATESWNLRDRHMFDTLQQLMAHHKEARAVVWAHNSHIGNASATAMGWQGEFNIGELVRKSYGDQAVLIGFGTDRGTVAAASDWGEHMQVMKVRPARDDSWEKAFRLTGLARSLTDWRTRKDAELVSALSEVLLERAIGVVYRPHSELTNHYFEAVMADQFDAFVWFEESRAVTPLGPEKPSGAADTWPFGL